jgi:hypothetical protein
MATGRKTGGRVAGQRNKNTKGCQENILDVFERIGGVKNFAEWAMENQTEFYRHYAKLLPLQVNAKVDGDMRITQVIHTIIDATESQNT